MGALPREGPHTSNRGNRGDGVDTPQSVMLPRMVAVKVYAPRNRGTAPPEHPFSMIFLRDGVEESHEFLARPSVGWKDYKRLMPLYLAKDTDEKISAEAIRMIDGLVRRALVNDDGTPEKWKPYITENDNGEKYFTDPQGNHAPIKMIPGFEAFEVGSSRRRWVQLMEYDDEVTLEPEQMVALFEDLISVASDRPTPRSEPSSP